MKKIKILAAVTVLAVIISCIGCNTPNSSDNPGSSGSSSGSTDSGTGGTGTGSGGGAGTGGGTGSGAGTGAGTGTGTGGGTGAGAGTESGEGTGPSGGFGTESGGSAGTGTGTGTSTGTGGGSGSGGGASGNPTPQYKWIMTHYVMESRSNSENYSNEYNYSTDYTYSFYNSDFDYGITSISESNSNVTYNGNTTNTSSNTKSVSTYSQTGNNINYQSNNYTMSGSSWVLSSESSYVYYKYVNLFSSGNTITYPAGTETTTNNTIELLDNSNGIERYKVTYPATYGYYCIFEFTNNRIHKQTNYYSATNKKFSETEYIYSNNSILQANNIELALTQLKSFDSNEQLTTQTNQTLENVTLNANNTITVILGNSTNTSTNYSYTTEIFTKMQVPFSQQ